MLETFPIFLGGAIFGRRVDFLCDGQRAGVGVMTGGVVTVSTRRDCRGQHDERYERGDQEHDHHRGEGEKSKEWKVIVEQLFMWNIAALINVFVRRTQASRIRRSELFGRARGSVGRVGPPAARLPIFPPQMTRRICDSSIQRMSNKVIDMDQLRL